MLLCLSVVLTYDSENMFIYNCKNVHQRYHCYDVTETMSSIKLHGARRTIRCYLRTHSYVYIHMYMYVYICTYTK